MELTQLIGQVGFPIAVTCWMLLKLDAKLGAFERAAQVIEVIGAVDDIAGEEADMEQTVFGKRVDEAHGIIHRIAAILAMENEIPTVRQDPGDGREQIAMSEEAVLLH